MMHRVSGASWAPAIATPVLRFAKHETGAIEVLSPWHPRILLGQGLIDAADPENLRVLGGTAYFNCTNGGAEYALSEPNGVGDRTGTLIRSW